MTMVLFYRGVRRSSEWPKGRALTAIPPPTITTVITVTISGLALVSAAGPNRRGGPARHLGETFAVEDSLIFSGGLTDV